VLFQTFDLPNMFVRSPGDFLYFLLVILFSIVSLVVALDLRQHPNTKQLAQRYIIALSGVILAWVVMIGISVYVVVSNQNPVIIIPPIDRVISVVVVLLVGWAFLTADHKQWRSISNILVLLFIAIAIIGYVWTAMNWANDVNVGLADFNLRYSVTWSIAVVAICALGVILSIVMFRVVVDSPLKLAFFALILAGALYQTLQGSVIGSYAGVLRFSFVVALALVPVILYRLLSGNLQVARERTPETSNKRESQSMRVVQPPPPVPRPIVTDNQSVLLLKTLGLILEDATAASLPERILMASLDILKADVGVLLRIQDANYADIAYAYDKQLQRKPTGISLNLNNQPTLANVIERQLSRTLYVDRNKEELDDFFSRLDIDKSGTVYFYPLVRNQKLIAVLGITSPYTERQLDTTSQELLKGISILASSLLSLSDEAKEARIQAEDRAIQAIVEGVALNQVPQDAAMNARQEMQSSLQLARDQIAALSKQVVQMKLQLDDERSRIANLMGDGQQPMSISQRITAFKEEQQKVQEERDRLAVRLQEAEAALMGATATNVDASQTQLVQTLEREKQKLLLERDRLQTQLHEMQIQGNLVMPEYMQSILNRMQEEQSRLEVEKNQLSDKLVTVENQLHALGIENDVSGLAQLISQLYDERATLLSDKDAVTRERDLLLSERVKVSNAIQNVKDTDARIIQLQTEIENLAQDRETVTKQRDKFRSEVDELNQKIDAVKEHRAKLLAQASGYEMELSESNDEQVRLRAEIQQLADSRSELITLRDKLTSERETLRLERDTLLAHNDNDTVRVETLQGEGIAKLQALVEEIAQARNQLEHELNEAKKNLANTQLDLEHTQLKLENTHTLTNYQGQNPELFVSLVQELRTPTTSLMGYVDLLLGESAGILGEMQRKFLQRVSANIVRLETMINDLIKVSELDTGSYVFTPMPISVVALIEDAITNATVQFREKALTVNLNLDDDLPFLPADKDAVTQIFGQLVTNAYLVSPPNSEITVTAVQTKAVIKPNTPAVNVIQVSVEDRGGGIVVEDIPRVFARKYKAENPLIQGLGDTGVGLSIAKALADAHGGKLWIETKQNIGTNFSFVLPLVRLEETGK
jgi:signal transduction histidine kinase